MSALDQLMRDIEEHMARNHVDERRRFRMLDTRLDSFAHDRRNGDPFDSDFLEWKRRYDWARSAWLCGFLSAPEFHRRTQEFEAAIAAGAERMSLRYDAAPIRALTTLERCQQEERRLRRLGRDRYVDRRAWIRLAQARKEIKERDQQWQEAKTARAETARQRARLREGRRTLTALRRHLRAPGQSPLLASEQATSSPIL